MKPTNSLGSLPKLWEDLLSKKNLYNKFCKMLTMACEYSQLSQATGAFRDVGNWINMHAFELCNDYISSSLESFARKENLNVYWLHYE